MPSTGLDDAVIRCVCSFFVCQLKRVAHFFWSANNETCSHSTFLPLASYVVKFLCIDSESAAKTASSMYHIHTTDIVPVSVKRKKGISVIICAPHIFTVHKNSNRIGAVCVFLYFFSSFSKIDLAKLVPCKVYQICSRTACDIQCTPKWMRSNRLKSDSFFSSLAPISKYRNVCVCMLSSTQKIEPNKLLTPYYLQ